MIHGMYAIGVPVKRIAKTSKLSVEDIEYILEQK